MSKTDRILIFLDQKKCLIFNDNELKEIEREKLSINVSISPRKSEKMFDLTFIKYFNRIIEELGLYIGDHFDFRIGSPNNLQFKLYKILNAFNYWNYSIKENSLYYNVQSLEELKKLIKEDDEKKEKEEFKPLVYDGRNSESSWFS